MLGSSCGSFWLGGRRAWDIRDIWLRSSSWSRHLQVHSQGTFLHPPWWSHVGRGLILDGTLHYRLTHHITRNMNALWDMLVGEVENGNFGPLVLTGNCVTDIWKHCGCLPAQSFEYVVKTELFTFFCTWKYFSLLLSTVAPNCLLVIAVAQQHLMSSVIFHFFQNRVLSVPIDSFFYFVCFLVSLNVSLCFHSSLFFCCL